MSRLHPKTGMLASGGLGLRCLEHLGEALDVRFVATDSNSTGIVDWAERRGVPLFKGNPRGGRLASFASGLDIDLLLSVNYLFLIEKDVIGLPNDYAINFHGSLLPKYRGRTPHVWAIINGETQTGITGHLITEGCDEGAIVNQQVVPIGPTETGADVLNKFTERYPSFILETVQQLRAGVLTPVEQDHALATYFGRRTPEDGEIDWDWSAERIGNWVRAQASPYPGAFTYLGNDKVIMHATRVSAMDVHANDPNGLIKSVSPLTVKVSDGCLEIVQYESDGSDAFRAGQVFGKRNRNENR